MTGEILTLAWNGRPHRIPDSATISTFWSAEGAERKRIFQRDSAMARIVDIDTAQQKWKAFMKIIFGEAHESSCCLFVASGEKGKSAAAHAAGHWDASKDNSDAWPTFDLCGCCCRRLSQQQGRKMVFKKILKNIQLNSVAGAACTYRFVFLFTHVRSLESCPVRAAAFQFDYSDQPRSFEIQ